ncbi:MAG: polysaccharide deacetylase family protein [Candidatus Omnitrophota bacterium]
MFKPKILIAAITVFVLAGALLFNLIQSQHVVPILMYHQLVSVSNPKYKLAVSADSFDRQMSFLRKYHYNVLSLEELGEMITKKKKIPPKTVAITFDDGYKDTYTLAFPILKKYNIPATLFIIVNEVERIQGDRVSWQDIKEMQASGLVIIGSHTIGPEPLVNIKSEQEIKRQIFDSKKILEEKLGRKVNTFSYPEGLFNPAIRKMVIKAGYKVAVATNPGKNYPDDDIFALKRLRVSPTSDNLLVFWINTTGLYNFIREHRHK